MLLCYYLLRLRRFKRKSVEVGVFRRGWVNWSKNFRRKGSSPTNYCWCQTTRVIALSCGIKIFTVHCLVLSQSTRVTDGQTDSEQNYHSQGRGSIAASRGKTGKLYSVVSKCALPFLCSNNPRYQFVFKRSEAKIAKAPELRHKMRN